LQAVTLVVVQVVVTPSIRLGASLDFKASPYFRPRILSLSFVAAFTIGGMTRQGTFSLERST